MSYRSSTLSSRVCGTPLGWVDQPTSRCLVITSVWSKELLPSAPLMMSLGSDSETKRKSIALTPTPYFGPLLKFLPQHPSQLRYLTSIIQIRWLTGGPRVLIPTFLVVSAIPSTASVREWGDQCSGGDSVSDQESGCKGNHQVTLFAKFKYNVPSQRTVEFELQLTRSQRPGRCSRSGQFVKFN
ncbi:hypothetical protein WN51_03407 [Melipona quadrifasciata]|uniref:Uncharacterized protein n=1 Tax=Melipona quadrifasciata TaxID=166423 RepID=A0A0M8ZWV7_9HYME|nr:hypothetical protein WN51_03407 [Melipona quadrifasciata]